jgi:archaellum component FlaC
LGKLEKISSKGEISENKDYAALKDEIKKVEKVTDEIQNSELPKIIEELEALKSARKGSTALDLGKITKKIDELSLSIERRDNKTLQECKKLEKWFKDTNKQLKISIDSLKTKFKKADNDLNKIPSLENTIKTLKKEMEAIPKQEFIAQEDRIKKLESDYASLEKKISKNLERLEELDQLEVVVKTLSEAVELLTKKLS